MIMTVIKIKRGGCGVKYTDGNGVARYALKTPKDGAFECEIEQAKRLVALGVAEVVEPWTLGPNVVGEVDSDKLPGHLDAAQLESMDFNDLKKLAKDTGVNPDGKKKTDYIAAILAADIEPGEEADGDEPPALDAFV